MSYLRYWDLISSLISSLFTGKQRKNTRELAEEICKLCVLAMPQMLSLEGRFLNMGYSTEEFKEYRRIIDGLDPIAVFSVQMNHVEELDWTGLNYFWMELRDLVAKYIEKREEWRILAIDKRCTVFCRLPEIVLGEHLLKSQPRRKVNLKPYRNSQSIGKYSLRQEKADQRIEYGVISGINFSSRTY